MHSEDFRKLTYRFELAKILFFDIMFPPRSYIMNIDAISTKKEYSERFKKKNSGYVFAWSQWKRSEERRVV